MIRNAHGACAVGVCAGDRRIWATGTIKRHGFSANYLASRNRNL